jgi:hypothetical protein
MGIRIGLCRPQADYVTISLSALIAQRRQHAQLFSPWPDSLRSFMGQDPTAVAAFAYECYKADKELKT